MCSTDAPCPARFPSRPVCRQVAIGSCANKGGAGTFPGGGRGAAGAGAEHVRRERSAPRAFLPPPRAAPSAAPAHSPHAHWVTGAARPSAAPRSHWPRLLNGGERRQRRRGPGARPGHSRVNRGSSHTSAGEEGALLSLCLPRSGAHRTAGRHGKGPRVPPASLSESRSTDLSGYAVPEVAATPAM